jgi:hypothetical protein
MSTAAVHAPTETTIVNVLITIHIMSAPIADSRKVLPAWCSKFVTIGAGMGSAQNYLTRAAMTQCVSGIALLLLTRKQYALSQNHGSG